MAGEIRIGTVCAVYDERHTVRVKFEDTGLVSNELKVKVPSAEDFQFYCLPVVGAEVECTMQSNGTEEGCVSGGFYSSENLPPFSDAAIVGFKCGEHLLTFHKSTGVLTVKAGGGITFIGDLTVQGKITADKMVAGGISLTEHVHSGVQPGGGKSGGPA